MVHLTFNERFSSPFTYFNLWFPSYLLIHLILERGTLRAKHSGLWNCASWNHEQEMSGPSDMDGDWRLTQKWMKQKRVQESILYSEIWKKIHEEDLKQTRRDQPVCKKKFGNYNKCEFSNFFLFQWPKMIISVLVTWMTVDCNLAVRVVLSF